MDLRLAGGESPDRDRLLAVRAAQLVAPQSRFRLASEWEAVLEFAQHRRAFRRFAVPLACAELAAAQHEVCQLIAALRANRPVQVAGVALAQVLLRTATSPVYRVGSSDNIRSVVLNLIRLLEE